MKTLLKFFAAVAIAMVALLATMAVGASTNVCITAYVTTALIVSFLFGAFDVPEKEQNEVNNNAAHYRDAA